MSKEWVQKPEIHTQGSISYNSTQNDSPALLLYSNIWLSTTIFQISESRRRSVTFDTLILFLKNPAKISQTSLFYWLVH